MPQPEHQLAIVGYGKMGRLIEHLAPAYGFTVALKLDEFNNGEGQGVTKENFAGVDVAIDFSIPPAVRRNVEGIAALGVKNSTGGGVVTPPVQLSPPLDEPRPTFSR